MWDLVCHSLKEIYYLSNYLMAIMRMHFLQIVDKGVEGQCNSKCKTVEQACQKVMGYLDTDVAEYVYTKNPSVQSLVKYLCHDLSGACSAIPPPLPKVLFF